MKLSRHWTQPLVSGVAALLGNHFAVGGRWAESLSIAVISSLLYAICLRAITPSSTSK